MFVVKAWKKDILKDLGSDAQTGGLAVDFSALHLYLYSPIACRNIKLLHKLPRAMRP
jgi:hypothetical protein